ncbi:MAG: hypothetical protein J3K34DRAFT_108839 [Monoraphidium minutum]|nr:MAG: hypothetical protein J3K34DRAFT_108839 [Monoraphidium minutum]
MSCGRPAASGRARPRRRATRRRRAWRARWMTPRGRRPRRSAAPRRAAWTWHQRRCRGPRRRRPAARAAPRSRRRRAPAGCWRAWRRAPRRPSARCWGPWSGRARLMAPRLLSQVRAVLGCWFVRMSALHVRFTFVHSPPVLQPMFYAFRHQLWSSGGHFIPCAV